MSRHTGERVVECGLAGRCFRGKRGTERKPTGEWSRGLQQGVLGHILVEGEYVVQCSAEDG